MGVIPQRYDQKDDQFRQHYLFATRANSNFSLVSGAFTTVVFNSEFFDESSAFNIATGEYTVPQNGMYSILVRVRVATATPPFFAVCALFRNGTEIRRGKEGSLDNGFDLSLAVDNKFTVGDVLTFRVFIGGGETTPVIEFVENTGIFNHLTIRRVGT